MRRFWFLSAIAAVLAGAGFYATLRSGAGGAADAPYRLASVDRGPITASVRATGTLNPVTTVLVGSQLSGKVVDILVDYNSPVKAGQVVARLDPEQIKTRRDAARSDVAQARADLLMRRASAERIRATRQKAEAALLDIKAQRDRAAAQLTDARRALERQTALTARNVGAQTALDTAGTQVDIQTAALASATAQIASAEAELKGLLSDIALADAQVLSAEAVVEARQAKLRDIEIDLERTEIRSPVDGVVVQRQVDLGQTVAASLSAPTLFTVAQDLREIDIHANVDEADVGRLAPGQPASFTVNAYPARTFAGRVRMVRLSAQTVQNVVTYTAVIRVENRDLALLPGMTANLQIVTEERPAALRVANAALRFRPVGPGQAASPLASPVAPASATEAPRGRTGQDWRERLLAEVQPTPEQRERIRAILAETRRPAREAGQSDEERRTAMQGQRAELIARIAAELDPERRAKLESLASTMAERRGGLAEGGLPGRIHVIGEDGRLRPIAVRLGITDGTVTEIVAGEIEEGAAVVTGGGPKPQGATAGPDNAGPAARGPRGPRMF